MRAPLSTHVLDVARGVPAAGIAVSLYAVDGENRRFLTRATTDEDGRTGALAELDAGTYELVFAAGAYFTARDEPSFYDEIAVRFVVTDPAGRHHVPLLLSPFGYSTYRGS